MITINRFGFNNIILREKAFKIRHEVFVIEQNCPEELEYENEEEAIHFLLQKYQEPLATARYRKTEKGYKLERFAVLKKARGKGYGIKILKAILEDLKEEPALKYLHAQVQVIPFYEKIGFKKVGTIFEEAGIMHYKMILKA